jgi:hypothetical protein
MKALAVATRNSPLILAGPVKIDESSAKNSQKIPLLPEALKLSSHLYNGW